MKVIIEADQKSQVQKAREALQQAIDGILAANQALSKLEAREQTLIAEISDLEASSPDNAKAIRALGDKRLELEITQRRLGEASPTVTSGQFSVLHTATRSAAQVIARALKETEEVYLAGVAQALRPFCSTDAWARGLALQTSASVSLASVTRRAYGTSIVDARAAVARMDEILSGELAFNFDPNLAG
jgi:hypothetical protein